MLASRIGRSRTGQTKSLSLGLMRPAVWRYEHMNAKPTIHELHRIRRDIGVQLRIEPEVFEPPPQLLMALLKKLEIHVHDAEGERLFVEVDARVAELLRAAG